MPKKLPKKKTVVKKKTSTAKRISAKKVKGLTAFEVSDVNPIYSEIQKFATKAGLESVSWKLTAKAIGSSGSMELRRVCPRGYHPEIDLVTGAIVCKPNQP
jgi:hypothetical protein